MDRVELTAVNGRTLTLEPISHPDTEAVWSYQATLTVPGAGAMSTVVYERGQPLEAYFRELADAWTGFDGVKSFASLEDQLTIDARHDGLGSVWCLVRLRQPWPPEWELRSSLDFGAGAHLDRVAADLEMLIR